MIAKKTIFDLLSDQKLQRKQVDKEREKIILFTTIILEHLVKLKLMWQFFFCCRLWIIPMLQAGPNEIESNTVNWKMCVVARGVRKRRWK